MELDIKSLSHVQLVNLASDENLQEEVAEIEDVSADSFWVKFIAFTATVVLTSYWVTEFNQELKN